MEDLVKDRRFAHIANDPRFKTIPRSQRKVKIDKRFQGMFKDKKFKMKYTVDKRGRPTAGTSNEDLERFYDVSSDDSTDSDVEDSKIDNNTKSAPNKQSSLNHKNRSHPDKLSNDDEDEGNELRSDDELLSEKLKTKLRDLSVDYARGEGEILSDSSSDEETSEDDDENVIEHEWGEFDKEAERTDEITHRLAVCNMDWDRIRAVDLMVLFNSFTPPGGLVHSVTIYPSQFGLERMKKEEEEGPQELVKNKGRSSVIEGKKETASEEASSDEEIENDISNVLHHNDLDENEEGKSFQMENLRKYQLNRLKYFYAIVECDSPSTANHIYNECDCLEYESSATRLDLRFVPEDTTFEEKPRETCTGMPDTSKYLPRSFTTTALQQGKVELTWDETDPSRAEVADRLIAGDKVDDSDLKAYLASSSDDDDYENNKLLSNMSRKQRENEKTLNKPISNIDEATSENSGSDEDDSIAKYRSLLTGIGNEEENKKSGDVHMEISWDLGLKEKAEEAVKKRISSQTERTPFQEMMEKRKEKRKEKKKAKLASSKCDTDDNLFSDDEVPSDIDMNDPFFAQLQNKNDPNRKSKHSAEDYSHDQEEEESKKAELELLLLDEGSSKHFNFKKIQEAGEKHSAGKKKKKRIAADTQADDNFMINVNDSRFSSIYSSHHFNIDPTDPHFKRSQGMDALISAKQRRHADQSDGQAVDDGELSSKRLKKDPELSALIKSVKHKTKSMKK